MSAKNFQLMTLGAAMAATTAFTAPSASAAEFDWSYSGSNGGPVTASGMLDATPISPGVYDVTSFTGTRNGIAITGLAVYAGADNEVYTTTPHVDYPGLGYSIVGGSVFNVYSDTSTSDSYACGAVGYCEIGPGVAGTTGLGPPVDSIGPVATFTLTAVPEPASWAMVMLGFAGLGLAGYRASRRSVALTA